MKKLILIIIFIANIVFADYENFIFNKTDNLFQFKGQVNYSLSKRFVKKILTYEKKTMYVYFDSPGGSVVEMFKIINAMKASDVNFVCFAKFAASAAFSVFQYCDERIIVKNGGILMSHQASIQIGGNISTIIRLLTTIQRQIDNIKKEIANRLGMDFFEYDYKISKDWWLDSVEAINNNAADYVNETLICTKELANKKITRVEKQFSIFGPVDVNVEEEACPLLD